MNKNHVFLIAAEDQTQWINHDVARIKPIQGGEFPSLGGGKENFKDGKLS